MPKRPTVYGYYVEGSRYGGFPLDMLRYSQSYPVDADIIHALLHAQETGNYGSLGKRVRVRLSTILDPSGAGFHMSSQRWESFGWKVVEVVDHELTDLGWFDRAVLEAAED